jgi:hypothetical protein
MESFLEFFMIRESLTDSYNFNQQFKRGENGKFESEQIVDFVDDSGNLFAWKATRTMGIVWSISFGVKLGSGKYDINQTNKGNAFRIFATVLGITNAFIDSDQNNEIRMIVFTSKEDNRTKLYKRGLRLINGFELSYEPSKLGGETEFVLQRKK